MSWRLLYTKAAQKDAKKLAAAGLKPKAQALLEILSNKTPTRRRLPSRSWSATCRGAYSRRINIQHRLVYQVLDEERVVKVLRMWTHYESGGWGESQPF